MNGLTGLLFCVLPSEIMKGWERSFQSMFYGFHYTPKSLHNLLALAVPLISLFVIFFSVHVCMHIQTYTYERERQRDGERHT